MSFTLNYAFLKGFMMNIIVRIYNEIDAARYHGHRYGVYRQAVRTVFGRKK